MAEPSGTLSMPTTPQQDPSLLTIAPELRNMIYGMVISVDEVVEVAAQGKASQPIPALAQVNQQCRSEILPLYYGKHFLLHIDSDDTDGPKIWHGSIDKRHSQLLKRVTVHIEPSAQEVQERGFVSKSHAGTHSAVRPAFGIVKAIIEAGTSSTIIEVSGIFTGDAPVRRVVDSALLKLGFSLDLWQNYRGQAQVPGLRIRKSFGPVRATWETGLDSKRDLTWHVSRGLSGSETDC